MLGQPAAPTGNETAIAAAVAQQQLLLQQQALNQQAAAMQFEFGHQMPFHHPYLSGQVDPITSVPHFYPVQYFGRKVGSEAEHARVSKVGLPSICLTNADSGSVSAVGLGVPTIQGACQLPQPVSPAGMFSACGQRPMHVSLMRPNNLFTGLAQFSAPQQAMFGFTQPSLHTTQGGKAQPASDRAWRHDGGKSAGKRPQSE